MGGLPRGRRALSRLARPLGRHAARLPRRRRASSAAGSRRAAPRSTTSTSACSPSTSPELGAARRGAGREARARDDLRASSPPCARSCATRSGRRSVPDARLAPRRAAPAARRAARGRGRARRSPALEGDGPLALRNRALVELVYSAGLRSAEAVGLDLGDVDFEQEHVHVRHGKGGKDRVVPLGEEAAHWLARYLRDGAAGAGARRRRRALPLRPRPPARHARPCAGISPTPTACATPSPRTCSRAAPTCARSRSCSGTARSRPRRCTATSTRSGSAGSTTARIRAHEPRPGRLRGVSSRC